MVIGMGAVVKSFRDLNVYMLAREVAQGVFLVSKTFPNEERFSLTDQIRGSSRAINAMIAEARARRRHKAAFGSYLKPTDFEKRNAGCNSISAMLSRMIDRADDFCKNAPDTGYRTISPKAKPPITCL